MRSILNYRHMLSPQKVEGMRFSSPACVTISSTLTRYRQYVNERFMPRQFLTLSAVISSVATLGPQMYFYGRLVDVTALALCFAAVFLLLLRLRLIDELKDLKHDRLFYPDRPVSRGLVLPAEIIRVAVVVFLLETNVATVGGITSLGAFIFVAAYSFLTLKEFFVRDWLRKHFTTYILSHEVLVLPVSFYFYSLGGFSLSQLMQPYFYFLTAFIAGQFFILEVSRKLRHKEISADSRDTYTANYGIRNSCILVGFLAVWVVMTGAVAAVILLGRIPALGYAGLALLIPAGFSLVGFVRRPDSGKSRAVFKWSVVLVIGASILFNLSIGLMI